jgi:protein required for attachment to host cells
MKKLTSLIVVADSQKAKIFAKTGHKKSEFNLICDIDAELDVTHDKPGRTFNSTGSIRHAIEPHTDRRQVEKHDFATKISKTLFDMNKEQPCDDLILLASHKMLQELEDTLSNELKQKVTHKLAKNLIEFNNDEIREYIAEHIK